MSTQTLFSFCLECQALSTACVTSAPWEEGAASYVGQQTTLTRQGYTEVGQEPLVYQA